MTKEEFKQLRAEAGFSSDSGFLRKMGYLSSNVANNWLNGRSEYPKFLRNIFFLLKLNREFNADEFKSFLLNLKSKLNEKKIKKAKLLKKDKRNLIKRVKAVSNNLSLEELKNKNAELQKELEVLEKLALEVQK